MGRDKDYPLTTEQALNAADLLGRVNYLFAKLGIKTKVTSGYRPGPYNTKAGGAKNSPHLMCMAIDVLDSVGVIGSTLKNNTKILEEVGLYLENPEFTVKNGVNWVHLQSRAPRSGNRIFNP